MDKKQAAQQRLTERGSAPLTPEESMARSRTWLEDQYRRVTYVAGGAVVVAILSILLNVGLVLWSSHVKYFAVTKDLKVMEMTPLDQPTLSDEGLLDWTAHAVKETVAIDFLHYQDQLLGVSKFYTGDAFNEIVRGLMSSGNLDYIKKNRLTLTADIPNAPLIAATGQLNGRLTWQVRFPITISYESSQGVANTQNVVADVVVQRQPVDQYSDGLAIIQLNLKPPAS